MSDRKGYKISQRQESPFWFVRFTPVKGGRERRISTGETDRARAEAKGLQIYAKACRLAARSDSAPGEVRLCDCRESDVLRWEAIAASEKVNPTRQSKYLRDLWDNHIIRLLKNVDVRDLTGTMLEDYKQQRFREGASKQSAKKELARVKWAVRQCFDRGILEGMPLFPEIKGKSTPDQRRVGKVWPLDKLQRFMEHLPEAAADELRFILITGMRREQMERIKASWVVMTPGQPTPANLVTPRTEWKTKKFDHVLPIPQAVLDILHKYWRTDGKPLFPASSFDKAYERAAHAAGLPRWATRRDVRATFATKAEELGVSIAAISSILGHTNLATTSIYIKTRQSRAAEATLAMAEVAEAFRADIPHNTPVLRVISGG